MQEMSDFPESFSALMNGSAHGHLFSSAMQFKSFNEMLVDEA